MYISEIILHISYFKAGNDLDKTFHKDNTHNIKYVIKYSEKIDNSLEKLESCTRLLNLKIRLMRKTLDSFFDGFIQSTFSSSHYCKEEKGGTPTGKCISLNISKNLPHFRGFGCRILKEKIDSSEECLVSRTRSIYKDCEGISPFPSIYQHQHKETREELPRALPVLRNVFLPFSLTS